MLLSLRSVLGNSSTYWMLHLILQHQLHVPVHQLWASQNLYRRMGVAVVVAVAAVVMVSVGADVVVVADVAVVIAVVVLIPGSYNLLQSSMVQNKQRKLRPYNWKTLGCIGSSGYFHPRRSLRYHTIQDYKGLKY